MARFRRRIDLSKPMISSKISVAKTGVTIDSISKLPPARALVLKIYHQHKGRYGYRRIRLACRNEGGLLNGKTVRKLMKELGISSLIRVKKYRSYKGEQGRICDNLLKRNFDAKRPNEKWVTDVTEFKVNGKKLYLSPSMDLYNGEIISSNLATHPQP